MARKETVTIQRILDTAFIMTREEGFVNVTARKLAAKIGCSTQPIFRVYSGMPELSEAVYDLSIQYFRDFQMDYPSQSSIPFVDLGLAYIQFASQEKNIFTLLFLSEQRGKRSLYELLNGEQSLVAKEIAKAGKAGCPSPSELFMKMWIFIHGAACMAITGDYDLTEKETLALLEDSYHAYAGI